MFDVDDAMTVLASSLWFCHANIVGVPGMSVTQRKTGESTPADMIDIVAIMARFDALAPLPDKKDTCSL
jgi:hypothetical protein